jgi:hypothetical protein
MACNRQRSLISRRAFLQRWGCGFGAVALATRLAEARSVSGSGLHHPATAKRVVFLYMDGGPSQMDTFDPKPRLTAEHGRPFALPMEPTQFDNNGAILGSPWVFKQYGASGLWISDLFPHISRHADRLAVLRSMTSQFSEHTSANYFLHTGLGIAGRPSMGAWCTYGLGSESDELPGFVVINGGLIPPGGLDCFGSGFLPASQQASLFASEGDPIANLRGPVEESMARIDRKRALLQQLDANAAAVLGEHDAIESAIRNQELAFRMQRAVPEAASLADESSATLAAYGCDHANRPTATFARECLLARRLLERGVRFIELTCPSVGHDRWDQHSNLKAGHEQNALAVDQPIAALMDDLIARGLWDDTLLVWSGEFGRTPFAQGADGRDHNPFAFSLWLAGGPVRGGTTFGTTDEYGYKVVEHPLEIYDLHATMLHTLGIDHERLTFRFGGRDMRLTDVHGHVIREILA